jgi:hypothetical protein
MILSELLARLVHLIILLFSFNNMKLVFTYVDVRYHRSIPLGRSFLYLFLSFRVADRHTLLCPERTWLSVAACLPIDLEQPLSYCLPFPLSMTRASGL